MSKLNDAIRNGDRRAFDEAMKGETPDENTLNYAIASGIIYFIRKLNEKNAPINNDTLNLALLNGHPSIFDEILQRAMKTKECTLNEISRNCAEMSAIPRLWKLNELHCTQLSPKTNKEILVELESKYGEIKGLSSIEREKIMTDASRPTMTYVKPISFFEAEQKRLEERAKRLANRKNEIQQQDQKDFTEIQSELKKQLDVEEDEKKDDILAHNFRFQDQADWHKFWKETVPQLAQQFVDDCARDYSENSDGLAKHVYELVAKKRTEIATILGQTPIGGGMFGSGFQYGQFRKKENGQFRDIVFPRDERFGSFFEPMKKLLEKHSNSNPFNTGEYLLPDPNGGFHSVSLGNTRFINPKACGNEECDRLRIPTPFRECEIGILMYHVSYENINNVFSRLDSFIKQILDLKMDDYTNQDKLFFLLGNIMWYLGNVVPLQAGSAATTENFINALLVAKEYSAEHFKLIDDIPWYFHVKVTPRLEFVKQFPRVFKICPKLVAPDSSFAPRAATQHTGSTPFWEQRIPRAEKPQAQISSQDDNDLKHN